MNANSYYVNYLCFLSLFLATVLRTMYDWQNTLVTNKRSENAVFCPFARWTWCSIVCLINETVSLKTWIVNEHITEDDLGSGWVSSGKSQFISTWVPSQCLKRGHAYITSYCVKEDMPISPLTGSCMSISNVHRLSVSMGTCLFHLYLDPELFVKGEVPVSPVAGSWVSVIKGSVPQARFQIKI